METITAFDGPYRFLSNFWPCELEYGGIKFTTVEAAFQACKTLDEFKRLEISRMTAPQAKKAGKSLQLRKDWEQVKLDIMYQLVRQKFYRNMSLHRKLLDTGDLQLVEGNWWGDTFWGICNGQGHNHLGKILMKVRDELKHGTK